MSSLTEPEAAAKSEPEAAAPPEPSGSEAVAAEAEEVESAEIETASSETEAAAQPEPAVEESLLSVPRVIDVKALLAPIPGDNPAGEPPSVLYDEITEVRRSAGKGSQGAKAAEWEKVLAMTTDALKTRTKDLGVSGWMTEALVKLHGLAGLRDGLRVVRGLHESFWDNLYPQIGKNGDLEGRSNYVAGLGRWAAEALKGVPLTDAEAADSVYTYNDWLLASRDSSEKAKQLSNEWFAATQATPHDFYERVHATVEECWAEFGALQDAMRERFGEHNQSVGTLKDTLEPLRGLIRYLYEERLPPERQAEESGATDESAEAAADGGGEAQAEEATTVTTNIRTRQEAVRQLSEVAAFFRQTEPQSPVSYLVERAVRWSDMSLDAWLASVIKNNEVLGFVRETLGVDSAVEPRKEQAAGP